MSSLDFVRVSISFAECNKRGHGAYHAKVTKRYEWLQAKNYWFVPVVAVTSGALNPETLRLPYDFERLLRMEAQLYSLWASATQLTGKH